MSEARSPTTHDFTRTMGLECCIARVLGEGELLHLFGWTFKPLRDGDYVLLSAERGARTTRYQLQRFRRPGDPPDQWFAEGVFAPRPTPGEAPR